MIKITIITFDRQVTKIIILMISERTATRNRRLIITQKALHAAIAIK